MEGHLIFNLDDLDDTLAYKRCVKATDMAMALWEIVYNTKKRIGYEMDGLELQGKPDLSMYEACDLVFDKIHEILEEHHIDIEDLIN